MPHSTDLILTLAGGLSAALVFGFLTQRIGLSPIVGYLLAGILVGPFTPGFVADNSLAMQCAEIGVILLMFGVGTHFHLKDLLAVRKIALPGAIVQIFVTTLLSAIITQWFGWTWTSGIIFGMAISVASTVVLTRVLADHRDLHTPSGHIAVGWLIVEDLFTILALVLLPAFFSSELHEEKLWLTLGLALLKLGILVGFVLVVGQKLIPILLGYIARTGSQELFTLTVLSLALGIAVASAKFFGASMALGAFLAGMIVGQSEYGERAASEALPLRDAFAVLFFVSVGMLFDPASVSTSWPIMLATLVIVLLVKPTAAFLVVLLLRRPLRSALSVSVALAQIGEFSFILAALAFNLKLLPLEATHALVLASVISITLNPLLYKSIDPILRWVEKKGIGYKSALAQDLGLLNREEDAHRTVIVGHGPIGKTLSRILRDNDIQVTIIEMNIDTVQELRKAGHTVIYGDATQREILHYAGVEKSDSMIITASDLHVGSIVAAARELNPKLGILTRATYLREIAALRQGGANAVFSNEGEIALAMMAFLMRELGATGEQIDRERHRIRQEFLSN